MIDVLSSDFVRTARAKGVARTVVIWKHCLRNAFLPVLSYLGPAAAATLTGSFVVEKVFCIPGLGHALRQLDPESRPHADPRDGDGLLGLPADLQPAGRHRLRASSTRGSTWRRRTDARMWTASSTRVCDSTTRAATSCHRIKAMMTAATTTPTHLPPADGSLTEPLPPSADARPARGGGRSRAAACSSAAGSCSSIVLICIVTLPWTTQRRRLALLRPAELRADRASRPRRQTSPRGSAPTRSAAACSGAA